MSTSKAPHFFNLTLDELQLWLPNRPKNSHKGMFGHVLVVGGDEGMPGAVRLAAEGALRIGAGLVSIITHPSHAAHLTIGRPELLCFSGSSQTRVIDGLLEKATLIILGPGLGSSHWSKQWFDTIMSLSKPLLIDADGLNHLAKLKSVSPKSPWILTPHPKEAARLLNVTTETIQTQRADAVVELSQRFQATAVLKGSHTLVADQTHAIYQCQAGNPGMASPGMGDLLTGIIAGFYVQGLSPWKAACAGVMTHAQAADQVAQHQGERGLLASDLLPFLPLLANFKIHNQLQ